MTAAQLICELQHRGVEVQVSGDTLRYRPVDAVDADLLAAIRQHKKDLLEWVLFGDCFKRHWGSFQASGLVN